MIPVKKLIELNVEHKSPIRKVQPLNDGAFVVCYDNYDCKVCNYLGNGFMINSDEYPYTCDFKLEDGLLYFNFIDRDWNRKVAFNMAGKFIAARDNVDFDKLYPKQELAKFKYDYPRMIRADYSETYFDKSLFDSDYGPQVEFNGPHNKYGVAWAINNGLLMQLPITVEKMNSRIKDIDDFVQISKIDDFTYKFMLQYVTVLRMIYNIAMRKMNQDSHRYSRIFDDINSSLDYGYCKKKQGR